MNSKKLLLTIGAVIVLSACNDRGKLCSYMVSQGLFNQTALEHCKAAVDSGDQQATVNYAKVLINQGNTAEATRILETAAEQKNLDAVLELMRNAVEQEDENAIKKYLQQGCELGHKPACDSIKELEEELLAIEKAQKQAELDEEKARLQAEHDTQKAALRKEKAEFEAKKAKEEANLARQRQELNEMYADDNIRSYVDMSKLKFNEGMAYFKDEYSGLYGFVNTLGNVVIPAKFKNAGGMYNGRAVVQDSNDLWGYIDKQGNWIIRAQYCMAGRFSEGLAGVYVGGYKQGDDCYGGKWGFITPSGKMAIEPLYDRAWSFGKSGGKVKAKVEVGNYTGYINGKGEWVD